MASSLEYKPNFGMALPEFKKLWEESAATKGIEFGFNSVGGYNTGLVIEKALGSTESMDQLAIRNAVFAQSGKLNTIAGAFQLEDTGAQSGMMTPLGQIELDDHGHTKFVVIYPPEQATGKPVYPAGQ